MLDLILSTVGQGLQWSVLALGVFLTFRILDIADLSVEGSFPLGAAVAATAITAGLGLPAAFVLALVAGSLAGGVTGLLTTKLRIPALLAGILTMIGLYSVNLHVMGKSNVGLLQNETVFTILENSLGLSVAMSGLVVGLVVLVPCHVAFHVRPFLTSVRFPPPCAPQASIRRWPAPKASTPTRWSFSASSSRTALSLSRAPPSLRPTASPTSAWAWARS